MNKMLFSLMAVFIISMNIKANNILDEDKIWILGITSPNVDGEFSQFICGDTLIENKVYQKAYQNSVSEDHYTGGLREENNQIYYRLSDEAFPELLLYDFNLNVNDTFNVYLDESSPPMISKVVVSKTLAIEFGEERQVYDFDDGDRWIEGIGSKYGLIYHTGFSTLLKGFIEDEMIIYCDTPFFNTNCEDFLLMHNCSPITQVKEIELNNIVLFPNPSSKFLNVDMRGQGNSIEENYLTIQNLRGVKILSKILLNGELNTIDISNLPNGLYYVLVHGKYHLHSKFVKN